MAWFVCPVFLKPYHMERGRGCLHSSGWCNHTNKESPPPCVIVAVMLVLCIFSNWTLERIFPMCVHVYVGIWYLEVAWSGSAEAGRQSRLAFVDWLVCKFLEGCWWGPHSSHACMTHGALSVHQSGQVHSPAQVLHCAAFKRATDQDFMLCGHVINLHSLPVFA